VAALQAQLETERNMTDEDPALKGAEKQIACARRRVADLEQFLALASVSVGDSAQMAARRSYGSGRVYVRSDSAGRETYYGSWWSNGRRVNRKLGAKRARGSREGLTAAQAEAELRRLMRDVQSAPPTDRLDVSEIGPRYLAHLKALGRKRSTLTAVEMALRVWIEPHLGGRALARVRPEDVENMMRAMAAGGVGAKSIRNYVGTLSAIFRYSMHPRRRWASTNPCEAIDLPALPASTEIRYLTMPQVEALADVVITGEHQQLDSALYLTAAMTGLRQGELIALRWQDIAWSDRRVRVVRNHVLGQFDTPKSRRSARSVPLSSHLVRELRGWRQATRWRDPDALVFAEPASGDVLWRGALMRRYRRAFENRRDRPAPLPRSATHVRDGDGGGRSPDADASGVDGPPGHRDYPALRGLCTERAGGRDGRSRFQGSGAVGSLVYKCRQSLTTRRGTGAQDGRIGHERAPDPG
jgi:integrase